MLFDSKRLQKAKKKKNILESKPISDESVKEFKVAQKPSSSSSVYLLLVFCTTLIKCVFSFVRFQ